MSSFFVINEPAELEEQRSASVEFSEYLFTLQRREIRFSALVRFVVRSSPVFRFICPLVSRYWSARIIISSLGEIFARLGTFLVAVVNDLFPGKKREKNFDPAVISVN